MEGGWNVALGAERQAPTLAVGSFWNAGVKPDLRDLPCEMGLSVSYRSWPLELAFLEGNWCDLWSEVEIGSQEARALPSSQPLTHWLAERKALTNIFLLRNKVASLVPVDAKLYVCDSLSSRVVLTFISFWKTPHLLWFLTKEPTGWAEQPARHGCWCVHAS